MKTMLSGCGAGCETDNAPTQCGHWSSQPLFPVWSFDEPRRAAMRRREFTAKFLQGVCATILQLALGQGTAVYHLPNEFPR